MTRLALAESRLHISQARALFEEYAAWLGFNLCFQNFDQELANLPGAYAPPDGRLLLAFVEDQLTGCIALRKIEESVCEMKRLFVRADFRGEGLGRTLVDAIIEEARQIGYQRMRLDTIPMKMKSAIDIYRSMGFKEIGAYYENPVPGALFMELEL
ncbi:MAG: hypothetical protein QOD75_323 [Blastocatellia bacterium]|jgi:GNAT superfamily N-acetyltransferase|nr:hypothetical protein [Blastocatellia bacterium]